VPLFVRRNDKARGAHSRDAGSSYRKETTHATAGHRWPSLSTCESRGHTGGTGRAASGSFNAFKTQTRRRRSLHAPVGDRAKSGHYRID